MSLFSRRGGPCNSDKCHCPDCRLTKVEGRVSTLELHKYNRADIDARIQREMLLERARKNQMATPEINITVDRLARYAGHPYLDPRLDAKLHDKEASRCGRLPRSPGAVRVWNGKTGPHFKGYLDQTFHWSWQQSQPKTRPDLWRRRRLGGTEQWFGPYWSNKWCTIPVTPWGAAIIEGKPMSCYCDLSEADCIAAGHPVTSRTHTVTNKVGGIEQTTTDTVTYLPHGDIFGGRHSYRIVDGKVIWDEHRLPMHVHRCRIISNPVGDNWIKDKFGEPTWRDIGTHDETFKIVEGKAKQTWQREWQIVGEHARDAAEYSRLNPHPGAQAKFFGLDTGSKPGEGRWHNVPYPKIGITEKEINDALKQAGRWHHFSEVETDIFIPKERIMSPIMLQVLLHAYYICEAFPESPASRSAVTVLFKRGLIERTTAVESARAPGWDFKVTEKGKVYVDALCRVPLPVQTEPKWEMPK